jgi:nucleotide-binding universal stress UspA family protein
MIRLDRILVPTDFSENSRCALEYAAALAERFNSELHLLYVLEGVPPNTPPGPAGIFSSAGDFVDELRASVRKSLDNLAKADPLAGKNTVIVVRDGYAFVEIVRYAREELTDLIVISTHGRTGLAQVLMGSVAEKVVRKAACPVLTVRSAGHQFVMP